MVDFGESTLKRKSSYNYVGRIYVCVYERGRDEFCRRLLCLSKSCYFDDDVGDACGNFSSENFLLYLLQLTISQLTIYTSYCPKILVN